MRNESSPFALEQQAWRDVPRLLAQWTGEKTQAVAAEEVTTGHGAQGTIDFAVQVGDLVFVVEVKSQAGISSVVQAAEQARAYANVLSARAGPGEVLPLVVVPYMTESGKARLEEEGVSWLDLSGNAHIRADGPFRLHVHIEGRPNRFRHRGRPKNLFAPKASRLTRYLLLHPSRSFSQRELAEATELDEGYVSRLTRRLEEEDLLVREPDAAVRPRDYDLLLDAWAEDNAYRHERLAGHVPARSGEDLVQRLAQALEDEDVGYAATGLAAAWAYTHAAGFRTATVYLREAPPEGALDTLGFRRDTKAPNLTLLLPDDEGVFTEARQVEGFWCVAPVQAFVDLQHEPERAEEFARALRAKHLSWNANNAETDA